MNIAEYEKYNNFYLTEETQQWVRAFELVQFLDVSLTEKLIYSGLGVALGNRHFKAKTAYIHQYFACQLDRLGTDRVAPNSLYCVLLDYD